VIVLVAALGAIFILGILTRDPSEDAPQDSARALDVLLFLLCLLGIVAAQRKSADEDLE
jgi:hypothetical protein